MTSFDLHAALINAKEKWNGQQAAPPQKNAKDLDKLLNRYEDRLLESPLLLANEYEQLGALLAAFCNLGHNAQTKLISLNAQLLFKLYSLIKVRLESGDLSELAEMRLVMQQLIVLVNTCVTRMVSEKQLHQRSGTGDWDHLKISVAENLRSLTSLPLGRIFDNASEKETLVSAVARTVHLLLEQPENIKLPLLLDACLHTLAMAAKYHNFASNVKTLIIQDLNFFEHLSEPCARLVALASSQYEYPMLCEELYRDLGSHNYTTAEGNSCKLIAAFFVKHAELAPRDCVKYLHLIIGLLDVEAPAVRMGLVEVLGRLIMDLQTCEDRDEQSLSQSRILFAQLEERLRDVNAFVRCKVLAALCELCKVHAIPVNRRTAIMELAIGRVRDKSSNVRKRAIQLLAEFVRSHPFGVDGGELDIRFFQERLGHIEELLKTLLEDEEEAGAVMNEAKNAQVNTLLMQKKYYQDACKFVEQIDSVMPTLNSLLTSSVKTEVFEVMDFLVDAHLYKIQSAFAGIRKMVQLVWEKDLSTEDGGKRSVKEHLIECYAKIYVCTDDRLGLKERLIETTQSLIKMMEGLSLAELACVEELMGMMNRKRLISDAILLILLNLIGNVEIPTAHRQNALKLFSFLIKEKRQLLDEQVSILKVSDATSCLYAVKCLGYLEAKLAPSNALFETLLRFVQDSCVGNEWLPVISQVITLFYTLCTKPQALGEQLIKTLTDELISERQSGSLRNSTIIRFLHVLGECSLAQVHYLDVVVEKTLKEGKRKEEGGDSLGMAFSAEDSIGDVVRQVKEEELLYSAESIVARFAPFVQNLANRLMSNSTTSTSTNTTMTMSNVDLYRMTLLTLGKLMCISSRFCEANLEAFLTLLETCPDAVVRGNMVIAFGDLALVFNRLVDPNLSFLTRRLDDADLGVKRKALLVLTHLALTGMIKAKGKLGLVAKLLMDPNPQIAHLARVFFHELAAKDNTVYNNLPDIISTLCVDTSLEEEAFASIVKHLFEYVRKERQMELLIEKLCQRFRTTDDPRHWRFYSHCLAQIPYGTEKAVRTLITCLPLYQDKLVEERVFRNFAEIIGKAKKFNNPAGSSGNIKAVVEEFERKVLEGAGVQNLTQGLRRMSLENTTATNTSSKRKNVKREKNLMIDEEEGEEDAEDVAVENGEAENVEPVNSQKLGEKKQTQSRRLSNRGRNLMLEDEE